MGFTASHRKIEQHAVDHAHDLLGELNEARQTEPELDDSSHTQVCWVYERQRLITAAASISSVRSNILSVCPPSVTCTESSSGQGRTHGSQ